MSFFIAVIVIAFYLWRRSRRRPKLSPYMLERFLKITNPVPLCGKPDVVWEAHDGILIVGDYKSRKNHKVYQSEVIQLSVYKLLVEKTQNRPVADYGFIHFKNRHMVKVNLMKEKEIIALHHRYWSIKDGRIKPCMAETPNYCRYCSHNEKCSNE
jgi:CRISPR/Cas system-associated exonuclease Cas4 (RecB family)